MEQGHDMIYLFKASWANPGEEAIGITHARDQVVDVLGNLLTVACFHGIDLDPSRVEVHH